MSISLIPPDDVPLLSLNLGEGLGQKQVLVLSYPRYCRYRSVVARLREQPRSLLTNEVVLALGGIAVPSENTHILYCRDTFRHPTLLHNESICDEFGKTQYRQITQTYDTTLISVDGFILKYSLTRTYFTLWSFMFLSMRQKETELSTLKEQWIWISVTSY